MKESKFITPDSIVQQWPLRTFQELIKSRSNNAFKPLSFKEVFGDLSNCLFGGPLKLSGLNLTSLEGLPKIHECSELNIYNNKNLKSLDMFFNNLQEDFFSGGLYLEETSIDLLKSLNPVDLASVKKIRLPGKTFKTLFYSFNAIEDIYKIDNSFQRINIYNRDIDIERAYSLYMKTGKDFKKFERSLKLCFR